MFLLSFGLFVAGVAAILQSVSLEGIEAPQPTPASNAFFYGGVASVVASAIILIGAIAMRFL